MAFGREAGDVLAVGGVLMTRDRHAYLLRESARGPLTQVEVQELLDAVEQSFGAVDAETDACEAAVLDANHWFIENTGRTSSFAAQHAVSSAVDAIRARKAGR